MGKSQESTHTKRQETNTLRPLMAVKIFSPLTSNSTLNSYLRRLCMYQHLPNHLVPSLLDSSLNQSLSASLFCPTLWGRKCMVHTHQLELGSTIHFRCNLYEAYVLLLESGGPLVSVPRACVGPQKRYRGKCLLRRFVHHDC